LIRPKLLLFPASLRAASHQRRLADHFAQALCETCEIDVLAAGEADLPIFNQDLEAEPGVLERAAAAHRRFAAAEGLVVATPEYNGHVSAYLKNTVDWVSRLPRIDPAAADAFRGKPVLLASASTGWSGGLLGLRDARTLFAYLGCLVSAEQICVSDADHWAAQESFVFEPAFAGYIDRVLEGFVGLVRAQTAHAALAAS
jgi:chromate reductase, NAD(P)H dehydrogenase (quinone)